MSITLPPAINPNNQPGKSNLTSAAVGVGVGGATTVAAGLAANRMTKGADYLAEKPADMKKIAGWLFDHGKKAVDKFGEKVAKITDEAKLDKLVEKAKIASKENKSVTSEYAAKLGKHFNWKAAGVIGVATALVAGVAAKLVMNNKAAAAPEQPTE